MIHQILASMIKRILLFVLLAAAYQSVAAQDVAGCTYLLEDAKEAYGAGMVELIPDLLLPCLGPDGLTGGPRREAYKLVINAYLFDHMPQEADQMMGRFVEEYPSYRAGDTDPAEFVLLLNTHLVAKGIDPDDAVAEEPGEETDDRRSRRPKRDKILGVSGHTFGFQVGGNVTYPQLIERYGTGSPVEDNGHFGLGPGFQLGATVNILLNEHFDISTDLIYNYTRFRYLATPLPYNPYTYRESGNHLQLPVSLVYKLNPEKSPMGYYIRAGLVADYLFSATGSGTRSNELSGSEYEVEKIGITAMRRQINASVMAGAGLRVPMNRAFFYAEVRVTSGILGANRTANRFPNNDLNWALYHVDSDFRVHQLGLCAGICWSVSNKEDL